MAKPIGTLGTVPTLTVNGRVFTDLDNLIILHGRVATATRWTTLRKSGSSSGYQVTAGKTLTISAFQAWSETVSTSLGPILLYGDTDVGMDSSSAPTNPVYVAGDTAYLSGVILLGAATAGAAVSFFPGISFAVPAQKYFAMKLDATNSMCIAYGYEA